MSDKLNLYFVAHLNLSYSSIPEEDYPVIIKTCYWPLLRLAEKFDFPLGIEFTGYTLDKVNNLDRDWVETLKSLCKNGSCEILASGYSQIIGPLVPKRVNEENIAIGLEIYEKLLNVRPNVVYVNEQAFSSGLADVYIDKGFDAMFMEWNNPYSANKEDWNLEFQYYPQYALSAMGRKFPTIWNNAISFQKLQRYIHSETTLDSYVEYLKSNKGTKERYFCMYGNDIEIFDYRPGRFRTEASIQSDGEWNRMEILFAKIKEDNEFSWISPSEVLNSKEHKDAFNTLSLCTSAVPLPVKKQSKYNITRWVLTGRDDVRNNGRCYELYNKLMTLEDAGIGELKSYWKELCYLWGSDFRTHITDEKYASFLGLQGVLEYKLRLLSGDISSKDPTSTYHPDNTEEVYDANVVSVKDGMVNVSTQKVEIVLDSRRGMAIDSLVFKDISRKPLIGALHHGFFQDISWGADFYSGHTIIQPINHPKSTSLEPVEVIERQSAHSDTQKESRVFCCSVKTSLGVIHKTIRIYTELSKVELEYIFEWDGLREASFHAGILTFLPDMFDENTLYYATHNGGDEERFYLNGYDFNHTQPVPQSIISAVHCLGATNGVVKIGDKDKVVTVKSEKYPIAAQPMIEFRKVDNKFLLRLYHSLGEHDETSYWMWKGRAMWKMSIEVKLING
ncbi:MAG: glycoside hydrolase family 57 [Candidatus Anammoxibacter sp.]